MHIEEWKYCVIRKHRMSHLLFPERLRHSLTVIGVFGKRRVELKTI